MGLMPIRVEPKSVSDTAGSASTHDILVWGATGFTGRLVVEHLTERYDPEAYSIAIGGRNRERLETLRDELGERNGAWAEIPIETGDAHDRDSLQRLASRTEVVCTTVGPYSEYGTPLVEACVETGSDYCDLSGEIHWIREMIDRYHEAALEEGVRIVHSCGFDSVPFDLGTLLVQRRAIADYGEPCSKVSVYLEGGKGGVSGGTLASLAAIFEAAATDSSVRDVLSDPYSLAPPGERDGLDAGEQRLPRRDRIIDEWTAPSPMAAVNERVIRRSNALLGYPWGRTFECRESVPTGSGPLGAATASALSGGFGLFLAGMSVAPVRKGLQKWIFPEPGEGPSRDRIESGSFEIRFVGRGTAASAPSFRVDARVRADRDPGYGATARMLGEAAVCLLEADADGSLPGGVLTPASGIGYPLIERLRDVGFSFEIENV